MLVQQPETDHYLSNIFSSN